MRGFLRVSIYESTSERLPLNGLEPKISMIVETCLAILIIVTTVLYKGIHSEAVAQRCSIKMVLLKLLQISQEKACSRVSFFNKGAGILTIFGILTMIIRKSPWKCLHNNWKLYYITATVNILMSNNMITILISLFHLKQILLINMEINSFKNTRLGSKRLNDETR